MSRNLGWPDRHNLSAADLREMAEALDALNAEQPQPVAWAVDVVAPEKVWERINARRLPAAADPLTWQIGQVEAWGWRPAMSAAPADCTGACGDGKCNCSGEDRTVAWAPPEAGR